MRRLLDTSVCVDALRGRGDAERRLRAFDPSELLLSTITVLELRVGAGLVRAPEAARRRVDGFIAVFDVLNVTREIAEHAAELRVGLRRRGVTLGDFHLLIAATALTLDLPLLTSDRDFLPVPGLRLDDWLV